MKQISNLVVVNQEEVNIVKSVMKMKMFGGVITARQDGWVKIMATGGSPVVSVVKSTIFSVLAFFFYQGFLSQTLTTHRTAGEGRGPFSIPFYHFHPLTNIQTFMCNFAHEMTITYF